MANLPHPSVELKPGSKATPAEVIELSRKIQENLEYLAKLTEEK